MKKKHYKQSKSRKLYDESCVFFDQYENNVTRKAYKTNYRKFIKFCREHYGCKTKAECMEHIYIFTNVIKRATMKMKRSKL